MSGNRTTVVAILASLIASPALAGSGGSWVEFVDETGTRLVAASALGANDINEKDYALGDVDKDGDLDIVCVRKQPFTTPGRRQNVLFMNQGIADGQAIDGVFVDVTSTFVVDATDGGQGFLDLTNDRDVQLVDVNGDTWLDIVTVSTISDGLPKTISHPRIYINKGEIAGVWQGFRYEEARFPQLTTIGTNLAVAPRLCSVAVGDVNSDGFPDLYIGDYDSDGVGTSPPEDPAEDVNDRLLINDGAGNFIDSRETRMTSTMLLSAFSLAAVIADMNGDGTLDVVKDTALQNPRRVSISYNDPNNEGFFDDFDIVYTNAPYHISVGDLNNDGLLDIVITDDGQDVYLLNVGNGVDGLANFTQMPFIRSGGADAEFGGNSVIVDLNNDNFNDVIIADVDVDSPGCNRRMHIYRNLGNLPMVTLQEQEGAQPWTPNGVHDILVFDINNDGWLDMFIGTCTSTEVWINVPPVNLVFTYPDGIPGTLTPNTPETFRVSVSGTGSTPQPATGKQFVSIDGGAFVETNMTEQSPNVYFVNLPGIPCTSSLQFYVSVETTTAVVVTDPPGAPTSSFSALASFGSEVLFADTFEAANPAWTVADQSLTSGSWERVDPIGTFFPTGSGIAAQPENDLGAAVEETMCYITEQHSGGTNAGANDVDGGPTILTSPAFDISGSDAIVSYGLWHFTSGADSLVTEVTSDGSTWVQVNSTTGTGSEWTTQSFKVSDFVTPSATIQVRFSVADNPNDSITESGIDNFVVTRILCNATCVTDPDCDDMVFCNGAETCDGGGACVAGTDPCPGQLCDEAGNQCVECLVDGDCPDLAFCDGPETCVAGACVNGADPCTMAGQVCDEVGDQCVGCLTDPDCDDAAFCNGAETCDGSNNCVAGSDPCPGQLCNEGTNMCVDCLIAGDCDDAQFCNGAEACVGGSCAPGTDPCPGQTCDEGADLCVDCLTAVECDDGLFCNGAETCAGGTCLAGADPCGDLQCDEAADECVRLLQARVGDQALGLTPAQAALFVAGQTKFDEPLSIANGLGPVFNQNACGACHNAGELGGSGSTLVTRFGLADKGGFDPLAQFGGSLRQANGISMTCEEVVPVEANVVINRITNSTFGAGLVEAIPGIDLLANLAAQPAGVQGQAHMVPAFEDGGGAPLRVGRFGWKAQVATVLTFSADAALNEMGLTNRFVVTENDPNGIRPPDLATCDTVADPEDGPEDGPGGVLPHFIDRVTDFQRFLAQPPQTPRSGMSGEAIFNSIGCADCHTRSMMTGVAPESALTARAIKPYSDFLLHNMGQLGDGIVQGDATEAEMRTPSLWGLRWRGQLMHDGRVIGGTFADRITNAIGEHDASGSQGAVSAQAFAALPQADKDALVAFMDSLGRAEFDHDGDNDVDTTDYNTAIAGCITGPGAGSVAPDDSCAISDFDQDGDVDLSDMAAMQQAAGQ
ncbi:MAG: hypothetical protein GXP29_08945 [Planctomycetes bacterium]|nr:hypothetical protein [Planctomycetota bacterium]